MTKHESILGLLAELSRSLLPTTEWRIVDYWDADFFALGIARIDQPGRLIYISSFQQPPGRFYVECEGDGVDDASEWAGILSAEQVVAMARRHLCLEPPGPPS